jgi:hypothetical protein
MEDFLERAKEGWQELVQACVAWIEYGVLCVLVLICFPFVAMIFVVLMVIPVLLAVYGLVSPIEVTIYVFTVMTCVGLYCFTKHRDRDEPDKPISGRQIISEDRAEERSRSMMRNSRHKRK